MPTDQAHAAASGVPIELGDRKLIASPLTDRQWGEMTRWLQSRHFRIAKGAIDPDLTEIEREREEQRALSLVSRLDARVNLKDIAVIPEGFNFWVWQMLRKAQPELKQEDVDALIRNSTDADNVYTAWKLIMHGEGDTKDPPQAATTA